MSPLPETRISLILRLASPMDVQAWQEFADLYAPAVFGLARRKGLQPVDAEDATQEVLFGVARAVERFDPDSSQASFRTWLSRIARNIIADFCRRRGRKPDEKVLEDWMAESECGLSQQEEQALESEYRTAMLQLAARRVRQRVSPNTWQAFHKTVVLQEKTEAAAESLSMAVGSLYVARSRVVKMLREETIRLERLYGEELQSLDALKQQILEQWHD